MNSTRAPRQRCRAPHCAAVTREERLVNWLALIALLALGIVWQ